MTYIEKRNLTNYKKGKAKDRIAFTIASIIVGISAFDDFPIYLHGRFCIEDATGNCWFLFRVEELLPEKSELACLS